MTQKMREFLKRFAKLVEEYEVSFRVITEERLGLEVDSIAISMDEDGEPVDEVQICKNFMECEILDLINKG
jgi:hypothetical protein